MIAAAPGGRLSLLLDKESRNPSAESPLILHVLVAIGCPVCSRAPTEESLRNSLLGFLDAVFVISLRNFIDVLNSSRRFRSHSLVRVEAEEVLITVEVLIYLICVVLAIHISWYF